MGTNRVSGEFIRNLVIGILVSVVFGIIAAYANLPGDVAVLKSQMSDTRADQADIKATVHDIANYIRDHR